MIPGPALALSLHPEHAADLRKSGLSNATIHAAGIYSASPGDLPRLCGRPVPDGTTGLVFPYADDFARVKLFPPMLNGDGRPMKYLQPTGSPVRAYIPSPVRSVLADSRRSLCVTEGEKKALALRQAGWPCIGLGGIWNFRATNTPEGELIPDLAAVVWRERVVYLVPDSDAWSNDNVLLAAFRLGRILERHGAAVHVVKLPAGVGGSKMGADDFLVAKGEAAFRRIAEKALKLGHRAFKPFREREKAKARSAEAPGPLPVELEGRRIHPALHFDPADGFATMGIVTVGADGSEVVEVVTSSRNRYPAEAIRPALSTKPLPYADLVNRWSAEDVERFLSGKDSPPRFADLVARIIDRLDALMEFRWDAEAVTLAVWAAATYFYKAFLAFPRLDLRGERGSGKSKALSILTATAFNGLLVTVPTPAILFRLAESISPTFTLDESEGLDSDQKEMLLAIFNMGYKAGGRVPRCEGDKTITIKSWSVFCPLAFGGIKGLNRTTEDRAITLPLVRGKDPGKINAEVDPTDPHFAAIRDLGYRLALLRWQEVATTARTLPLPGWLMARERELWKPLFVVAHLADREGNLGLVDDLLRMAREQGEERAGLSDEAAALVAILTEKLAGADSLAILPGDLCEDLQAALKWKESPTPGRVGRLLKGLGFPSAPRAAGGKRRLVTAEALADLRKRYGEPSEGG
jgi:hypothetical protein